LKESENDLIEFFNEEIYKSDTLIQKIENLVTDAGEYI
jgi:hypothetical protein